MDQTNCYDVLRPDDSAGAVADWVYLAASALLSEPVDAAISRLMREVGTSAHACRMWMFEYDDRLLRFRNSHEWCRSGIGSHVEDLQDAPATMIAWLHRFLSEGRAVMIHDVGRLPRAARSLQTEMLRQGDKSVLSVPVFHDGRLRACIGFDAVRAPRSWPPAEIASLFRCGALIAAARYGGAAGRKDGAAAGYAKQVYLRGPNGARGVAPDDIALLYAARNRTEVWLSDGSSVLDARPFAQWVALLGSATFMRIHRSSLVNLLHVQTVERDGAGKWHASVRAIDRRWPVSRNWRKELLARLGL